MKILIVILVALIFLGMALIDIIKDVGKRQGVCK